MSAKGVCGNRRIALIIGSLLLPLCIGVVLAGCAHRSKDAALIEYLQSELGGLPHACVPLGWFPVPSRTGTFYPGRDVEVNERGVWFPAAWLGMVQDQQLSDPHVRTIAAVLDSLSRKGLISRTTYPGFRLYRLTWNGYSYYYHDDAHGNNPAALPYLCYSHVNPESVVARSPDGRNMSGKAGRSQFAAAFRWRESDAAPWANDDFIRSHSIILPPTTSPTVAHIVLDGMDWHIVKLSQGSFFLAHVVDSTTWHDGKSH